MIDLERSQPVMIPLEIISFSNNGDVSCGDCVSACCRQGVIMPLSQDEASFMRETGTELEPHAAPAIDGKFSRKERRLKFAYYQMASDCGNLEIPEDGGPGVCSAFDNPERPVICGEFKTGSFCCRALRRAAAAPDYSQSAEFSGQTDTA